jgi:hypothetical protein
MIFTGLNWAVVGILSEALEEFSPPFLKSDLLTGQRITFCQGLYLAHILLFVHPLFTE